MKPTLVPVLVAAVLGQLVGLLGYVDATYLLLVLVAPLVTGAVAAAKRVPLLLVCVLWVSAGLNMLWVDWLLFGEDVVFHLVLSVVMGLLAAGGYGVAALATRRRRREAAAA